MATVALRVDQQRGGDYPEGLYQHTRQAELLPDTAAVGAGQEAQFAEQGFLAVRQVLDPSDIHAVLAGFAHVLDHPGGAEVQYEAWAERRLAQNPEAQRMDLVRKFMGFTTQDPRLEAIARDERILSVVRRLCDSADVTLIQDMALLKPPGGGREKPWHQDNAFFAYEPGTPIIGVWIALDEATVQNGCMHVIPGSHQEGPVTHFRRRDFQICDTDVDRGRDTAVPLPSGGALFFHGLVHHGTPANATVTRRRALQLHYVPYGTPGVPDERRLDIFGSEGKDATC